MHEVVRGVLSVVFLNVLLIFLQNLTDAAPVFLYHFNYTFLLVQLFAPGTVVPAFAMLLVKSEILVVFLFLLQTKDAFMALSWLLCLIKDLCCGPLTRSRSLLHSLSESKPFPWSLWCCRAAAFCVITITYLQRGRFVNYS